MTGHISHESFLRGYLRDPENLVGYLREMFTDDGEGDETRLRAEALKQVAEAWGLIDDLRAKLNGGTLPACKSDPPTPASPQRTRPERTKP